MSREQAEALREAFAAFRPAVAGDALRDFSGLRAGAPVYCQVAPRGAEAACGIVCAAAARGVAVRTRAQGHSLNGSSLPQASELLFSTRNLRQVRFERPGTVTVGSGVVLWALQYMLHRHGFDLPVLNDGYPGPSVGGYLAAGGFGPRSARYGGFWDNVEDVTLVDGLGAVQRIGADDGRFPWLFGSMGQLGVFLEARLAIVPLQVAGPPPAYPLGLRRTAPQLAPPPVPPEYAVAADESLFWFTLFAPEERLAEAHADLRNLERAHAGALRFQARYTYPIRFRGRPAPLVVPHAGPVAATGAWGWLTDKSPAGVEKLMRFDGDFLALAQSRPWYRRYVQSELPAGPATYERCLGPQVYADLRAHKAALDPRGLFNRGSVFPAPASRPSAA